MSSVEILDVNESNVEEVGFFCAMSKPELVGYQEKLRWLKERFREGLRLKMIWRGGRGFIEYIPGEYAWRGVRAPGYMVIHCLWVVDRSKGKGCAAMLLEECLADARAQKMRGVAAVTATGRVGFTPTDFFVHSGFRVVESSPSGIDLVALKLKRGPDPKLLHIREEKRGDLRNELTVISSPQCPYTYEGAKQVVAVGHSLGLHAHSVRLSSLQQLRAVAPSPYCSFEILYRGQSISNLFHCMTGKRLSQLIAASR